MAKFLILNSLPKSFDNRLNEIIESCNNYTDEAIADYDVEIKDYITENIDTHNTNTIDYINNRFNAVNQALNEKANEEDVNELIDKTNNIETSLLSKSDKNTIISTINTSPESEKISSDKVDITIPVYNANTPMDKSFSNNSYTSNGIVSTTATGTPTTIDELLDNITIVNTGLDFSLDVSNLEGTNYTTKSDDGTQVYINNNEIIKALLYEIKLLKEKIALLNP